MALNTIVVPPLRDKVVDAMDALYSWMTAGPKPIDKQKYPDFLKKNFRTNLMYININGNDKIHSPDKKDHEHYDYQVKSSFDLARLFMRPHMAEGSSFAECDGSALLGLVRTVRDSQAQDYFVKIRRQADEVRAVRNSWAHCKFTEWDEDKFEDAFDKMKSLVSIISKESVVKLQEMKDQGLHK